MNSTITKNSSVEEIEIAYETLLQRAVNLASKIQLNKIKISEKYKETYNQLVKESCKETEKPNYDDYRSLKIEIEHFEFALQKYSIAMLNEVELDSGEESIVSVIYRFVAYYRYLRRSESPL